MNILSAFFTKLTQNKKLRVVVLSLGFPLIPLYIAWKRGTGVKRGSLIVSAGLSLLWVSIALGAVAEDSTPVESEPAIAKVPKVSQPEAVKVEPKKAEQRCEAKTIPAKRIRGLRSLDDPSNGQRENIRSGSYIKVRDGGFLHYLVKLNLSTQETIWLAAGDGFVEDTGYMEQPADKDSDFLWFEKELTEDWSAPAPQEASAILKKYRAKFAHC